MRKFTCLCTECLEDYKKVSSAEENWEAMGRKCKEDILFTILDVPCAYINNSKNGLIELLA